MSTDYAAGAPEFDLPDSQVANWHEWCEDQGWGDGLPTVAPTRERVEAALASIPFDAGEFSAMPPLHVIPTLRTIAANAVMAGCKPQHLRAVVAAVRAVQRISYNLHGTLATTHPCAPMVLIGGPLREQLGVNAGINCFGQGARANAAIGRAVVLTLMNIGGGRPGIMDYSTQGSPAKYSFCFGENENATPWDPYHVRRGFSPSDSVVTVMAAEPPHNINDHGSTTGIEILLTIAGTMAQTGSNQLYVRGPHFLVLGPEHAATLHQDRWTPTGIADWLWEHARVPVGQVSYSNRSAFAELEIEPVDGYYTISTGPDMLHVVVAGGAGKHSAWVPSFGLTDAVSEVIVEHQSQAFTSLKSPSYPSGE